MDVCIRKGTLNDIDELAKLYDDINDFLAENTNYPGWRKGIYPTGADAAEGIREDSLFVAVKDNSIVGSLILRNKPEEAYYKASWKKELSYDKVFVIYTFVVHPDFSKQGIGSKMLEFAESFGRQQKMESLRLDVYSKNYPAIHLYEKNNFEYIDTVDLGLEEYGLKWFRLYEKLIL